MIKELLGVILLSSTNIVGVNSVSETQSISINFYNNTGYYFKHYYCLGYGYKYSDSDTSFYKFDIRGNIQEFYNTYTLNSVSYNNITRYDYITNRNFVFGSGYYLDGITQSYLQSFIIDLDYDTYNIVSSNSSGSPIIDNNLYTITNSVNGNSPYSYYFNIGNDSVLGKCYLINGGEIFNITLDNSSAIIVDNYIQYFNVNSFLINGSSTQYIRDRNNFTIDLDYTSVLYKYSDNSIIDLYLYSNGLLLYSFDNSIVNISNDNGYLAFDTLITSNMIQLPNTINNISFGVRVRNGVIDSNNVNETYDLEQLLFTIISLPFTFVSQGFNLSIFGITLSSIIFSILSLILLVWLIIKILKVLK